MATQPAPQAPAPQKVGTPRLPTPKRSAKPVKLSEIPSGGAGNHGGYWAQEFQELKKHPKEYFVYEMVGSSQVSYLRNTFGLDAKGRNTRTIDPDTLEVIPKDELEKGRKGTAVVDIFVGWDPDLAEDIKAGRMKAKRGRPSAVVPAENGDQA